MKDKGSSFVLLVTVVFVVTNAADAQEYVRIFDGICREQRVKEYYIQCHKVRECHWRVGSWVNSS